MWVAPTSHEVWKGASMQSLNVVLAGSSGFLGTHLKSALRERGHEVTSLVRHETSKPDESTWDPYAGELDRTLVRHADVVVNLAGSPTLGNPHSKKWARELLESRVVTTRLLAETIAAAESTPAYLAGNGISYYGDHGDAVLTEVSDTRGHALLTHVARAWQAAAEPASEAGARVCVLRTAPVMDSRAAPLQQLRLLFKAGLGGRLGNGRQYMAMISLRDWVGAVVHLAEHAEVAGPVNLCLPQAPTNAEFTKALGRAVHRPTVLAGARSGDQAGRRQDGARAARVAQRAAGRAARVGLRVRGRRRRVAAADRPRLTTCCAREHGGDPPLAVAPPPQLDPAGGRQVPRQHGVARLDAREPVGDDEHHAPSLLTDDAQPEHLRRQPGDAASSVVPAAQHRDVAGPGTGDGGVEPPQGAGIAVEPRRGAGGVPAA